jgi:L-lysine 2,3-aminomutase
VFSVVSTTLVAVQQYGKHISAAVNQHATIEEAVFSVGDAPGLYNEDLTRLEAELREHPELEVCRIIEKKWQERNLAVERRLYSVLQLQ